MGTVQRREREREARREQILEAAREVFRADGFEDAFMERIAERAEISRGTIYFHFRTQEELLGQVALDGLVKLIDRMETVAAESTDGAETLRRLAGAYHGFFADRPEMVEALARLMSGDMVRGWSPELLKAFFEAAFKGVGILAGVIERGVKAGTFREMEPLATARLMWAASFGFIAIEGRPSSSRTDSDRLKNTIELGYDLLMNGLIRA